MTTEPDKRSRGALYTDTMHAYDEAVSRLRRARREEFDRYLAEERALRGLND